jgi:hypothetical protein
MASEVTIPLIYTKIFNPSPALAHYCFVFVLASLLLIVYYSCYQNLNINFASL